MDLPLNHWPTPREEQVLQALGQGLSNKAIAEVLGIEVNTVQTHLQHIFAKFAVSNRLAAYLAYQEWLRELVEHKHS